MGKILNMTFCKCDINRLLTDNSWMLDFTPNFEQSEPNLIFINVFILMWFARVHIIRCVWVGGCVCACVCKKRILYFKVSQVSRKGTMPPTPITEGLLQVYMEK